MAISKDALVDLFCNEICCMEPDVKSTVVEAMVDHVGSCREVELREVALRLVEKVATEGFAP